MKKIGNEGFGISEGLLIAGIVAILGFVGWYTYQQSQKQDETSKPQSSTTQSSQKSESNSLIIQEWGVQISLTDNISDANYTIVKDDQWGDIAYLSTATLDKNETAKCKEVNSDGSSFQGIRRNIGTDELSPLDQTSSIKTYSDANEENPDAFKKISDYYYTFYHGNAQACSDESGIKQAEFNTAFKTIEAIE